MLSRNGACKLSMLYLYLICVVQKTKYLRLLKYLMVSHNFPDDLDSKSLRWLLEMVNNYTKWLASLAHQLERVVL